MARAIQFNYDFEKTKAALLYMAQDDAINFDKYKACKLLFLSDKRHLVKYGRTISGDRYCAQPHGPIPSETLDILNKMESGDEDYPNVPEFSKAFELNRKFMYPRLVPLQKFDPELLSTSDIEVIDEILKEYGSKGFTELKILTHAMPAYDKVWVKDGYRKSFPMSFDDFFEGDENAVAGTQEEMKENLLLKRYLAK